MLELTENKYMRNILVYDKESKSYMYALVDVYMLLDDLNLRPALQHAFKKLVQPGLRGHKDYCTDLQDIIKSVQRELELVEGRNNAKNRPEPSLILGSTVTVNCKGSYWHDCKGTVVYMCNDGTGDKSVRVQFSDSDWDTFHIDNLVLDDAEV